MKLVTMLSVLPQLFTSLLLLGFGESFSLSINGLKFTASSVAKRNNSILHARNNNNNKRYIGHHPQSKQGNNAKTKTPKRVPPNKRTAIRWIIQGVERCLSQQGTTTDQGAGKSYERRIDASLVDALYLLVNANSQKDVLAAEKRVGELMKHPAEFPMEVNERVIKATAMAGLSSLSLNLLTSLLHLHDDSGSDVDGVDDDYAFPSPMAYTAVLNALRRNGRVERLEETLTNLADAYRKLSQRTKDGVGVDVVAFNVHLAALCDAAVNEAPFTSSAPTIMDDGTDFNFTSLSTNSSSAVTATTSSSEKYLYKALNLLKGDVARTRFALAGDPDRYSYNSVLDAAAKCSKLSEEGRDDYYTTLITKSCLRGMKERGIQPDVLTYNARIRGALASNGDEAAIRLIDELISDPNLEPDRYTLNFLLSPFMRAGRCEEVWSLLTEFYDKHSRGRGSNKINYNMVSSAFEAFLNTIVQETGEVDFACEIFQSFFLPLPPKPARGGNKQRMHMSEIVHVTSDGQPLLQQQSSGADGDSQTNLPSASSRVGPVRNRPVPRTRHFNILFAGYSKAYLSAFSRLGKFHSSTVKIGDLPRDLNKNVTNTTMSDNMIHRTMTINQKAYALLDAMLDIGVPLDGFTVTSLMALPSTPENVTSLLERIEPEMMVELNAAAYRSIITAYGKVGDPSSACWMFKELIQSRGNQGRNAESWNVLLGALSKGCVTGANSNGDKDKALDILNSSAARSQRNVLSLSNEESTMNQVISHVNGKNCLDSSMALLDIMRDGTILPEGFSIPKPNSQSYCLVASALSGYGTTFKPDSSRALRLFRNATAEGVAADGRFLNAVLRCFGDDVEGALAAWKSDIGPAAAAQERRSRGGGKTRPGTNLMAAYNGLMHVCGRAIRPDAATRIAYAMNKANVEPTEVTLNSYFAGKRVTMDGNDDNAIATKKNLRLENQYESLLSVECTKYNTKDKRQSKDRKIRIILSN